jgi:hypothetical protein
LITDKVRQRDLVVLVGGEVDEPLKLAAKKNPPSASRRCLDFCR